MRTEKITPEEAMELWMAALHGASALALELERLGICNPDESLENAQGLRPVVLDAAEAARKDAGEHA